jgi:hypothetical protein
VGPALAGPASAVASFFLRRFQASFQWFFFFLLFHASMMSDLRVDVVDAHDAVVSESHPVSSPPSSKRVVLDVDSTSSCRGVRHLVILAKIGLATLQCSFTFHEAYKSHKQSKTTLKE